MLKNFYLKTVIFLYNCLIVHNVLCLFVPDLNYARTIYKELSLPYYVQFTPHQDQAGQYSFWVSNNPYGSPCSCSKGYIAKFKYDPDSFGFSFKEKIKAPNVLGLAPLPYYDYVYAGNKSFPAISKNGKFLVEATVDCQYILYNYCLFFCDSACYFKNKELNYYSLTYKPSNVRFSPFKFKNNGIKYQLLAVPVSFPSNTGQVLIFQYPISGPNIHQILSPIITLTDGISIPVDAEFSYFASSDGSYLLVVTNANSGCASVYKVNISNPSNISINYYCSINIGKTQQYFSALSNKRYLALDLVEMSGCNLYAYYINQYFDITPLNDGCPYKTDMFPKILSWSPDGRALVVPNYISNNLTVYRANTCNLKVELCPKNVVQYAGCDTVLTAKVYNGVPPYTFYFSNGVVIDQESDVCSITVSPLTTTIYNVTVVDANSCITGKANPVTVQVARPVIQKIVPDCSKGTKIFGQILDPQGNMVVNSKMNIFINNKIITNVKSNMLGYFTLYISTEELVLNK